MQIEQAALQGAVKSCAASGLRLGGLYCGGPGGLQANGAAKQAQGPGDIGGVASKNFWRGRIWMATLPGYLKPVLEECGGAHKASGRRLRQPTRWPGPSGRRRGGRSSLA